MKNVEHLLKKNNNIETKELLWSLEKQFVEVNSMLYKMTSAINNIIYKLNDMDKHTVLQDFIIST